MSTSGQRKAGRPRTRILTPKRITDAAMKLASSGGYEALTMAKIATSLGVTPGALYNHAHSKRQILRWVEDRLMARVDVSAFASEPPAEALRLWATSYRQVMREHDELVEAIAKMPITGARDTLAMYEAIAAALRDAGWRSEQIMPCIVALESFIYGSAYDLNAPLDIFDTGDQAERAPALTAAVAEHDPVDLRELAFQRGLEALIAGLVPADARPPRPSAHPTALGSRPAD